MSVTASTPRSTWAAAHRAVLVFVVLTIALAAALGTIAARTVFASDPVTTTGVDSPVDLDTIDDGCQLALPGNAC
jgi:hypothetical protein